MLGVIGGTVFFKKKLFDKFRDFPVNTKFGTAMVKKNDKIAFLPRHGMLNDTPPHKVNHRANILGLKQLGVRKVIGINSCGSLKKEIEPGKIIVPDDYLCLGKPETLFDMQIEHITPSLSQAMRIKLIESAKKLGIELADGGVYMQTPGPRLETKAEVRMFSQFADVIGMTMASEATLCQEMGMEYGAICSVDNFAHGLSESVPSHSQIVEMASRNADKIWQIAEEIAKE
ncbi:MAG: MTAP family purine nucleoside phosphorylase [Candidatus Diapherotrites archaeon]|nr:MTAP family purine nucleoside phosphorylase [Candidatus Diapherotrites archaeon]